MATFLEDLIPIFEKYHDEDTSQLDLSSLKVLFSSALRMIGEVARALPIISSIDLSTLSKSARQNALLTLTLCKESLRHPDSEIIAAAAECVSIDPKTHHALQAKSIIINRSGEENSKLKLQKLQEEARRKGAHVVSNNIAIELASASEDAAAKRRLLSQAASNARQTGDYYNHVRAGLKLCKISLDESGKLDSNELADCVLMYEYLFNQRMRGLFDVCHDVLWQAFRAIDSQKNMLVLFRHSSLIWRLRNEHTSEQKYIAGLAQILGKNMTQSILTNDRDLRYFISRSAPTVLPISTGIASSRS